MNDDLWRAYKNEGTKAQRDQLLEQYLPLVRYAAHRLAAGLPQSVDDGDLISYGVFGLIDAIEKYDPERGVKFETYAMARVRGAILDELRSIDWVPRSVRAKARAIDKAHTKLEGELHRTPTDTEIAAELEVTEEQLQAVLAQNASLSQASLDAILPSNGGDVVTLADTLADVGGDGPAGSYELTEIRARLAAAMNRIPERERLVLALYYRENLTLADVGVVLGVTESRVCQIHTKAIATAGTSASEVI